MALYELTQEREGQKLRFLASLQGVKLDAPVVSEKPRDTTLFLDPKEYENLSKEERQALTNKMMGVHKQAMAATPLGRTM
jgi:hypothetical protein